MPGPLPGSTIELLRSLGDRAVFVRGNTDRWTVEEFDALAGIGADEPRAERPAAAWTATVIDQGQRRLPGLLPRARGHRRGGLGATLFCHGSPRSDEEILTLLTPEERWAPMFAGVEQAIVICGHTHAQSDRVLGGVRVVNAGSVGMPFEGRPGAYLGRSLGPDVHSGAPTTTSGAAEAELRGGGWPGVDDLLRNSFLQPADPLTIAESLERQAQAALDGAPQLIRSSRRDEHGVAGALADRLA